MVNLEISLAYLNRKIHRKKSLTRYFNILAIRDNTDAETCETISLEQIEKRCFLFSVSFRRDFVSKGGRHERNSVAEADVTWRLLSEEIQSECVRNGRITKVIADGESGLKKNRNKIRTSYPIWLP